MQPLSKTERTKTMRKSILLSLFFLLATTIPVTAETRLVPSSYATIQEAINACHNGDVVIVEPGTYLENINFLGKNILVTSIDPDNPDIVATTIIDGHNQGNVVVFENGESTEAVLTGFTLTGGSATKDESLGDYDDVFWGAGIYCKNASPTITNLSLIHISEPTRPY